MKTNDTNVSQDISWEEIEKYIQKDSYQEFLKQIPPSVFKMALNEQDRPKVVKTILKVLKERAPQNATEAYAKKIADRMQAVARMVLEKREIATKR